MARSYFRIATAAFSLTISGIAVPLSPAMAVIPGSTAAVNTDANNLAMQGYDAVAYFTDGQPTRGDPRFATTFNGANYHFASQANLTAFQADPAAYAPQFGGFCAMGTSYGKKFNADPTVWKVVDGKLYLNYSAAVGKRWEDDVPGNIGRADDYWPAIKNDAQQ